VHVAVAIASKGRPAVLADVLDSLRIQRRAADSVWVSVTERSDVPPELDDRVVRVLIGPPGLTTQRNAVIDALGPEVDVLVFLDDDAELHPDYLARAEAFLSARPDVVLFSGDAVADGAATGQLDRGTARDLLAGHEPGEDVVPGIPAYGCNMVVRADVARQVRFDEVLPLYGWLEDRDFSVRTSRFGTVVRYDGCALVHLGVSGGRENGTRLGYQQVVHPAYLHRKGVLRTGETVVFLGRALLANVLRRSSGRVDRPGRLRGNLLGLRSVLRGTPDPQGVLHLP
jgi:glycosyltransferase involved in cell wall biosynthesis